MNIQADCYDLVIGLGEIGKPLLDILSQSYQIFGRDIETINRDWDVNVLHICYPYEIENFVTVAEAAKLDADDEEKLNQFFKDKSII